jgi:hypothetical protein
MIVSHSKPSGFKREAIKSWQPPSAGVTEFCAINDSVKAKVEWVVTNKSLLSFGRY